MVRFDNWITFAALLRRSCSAIQPSSGQSFPEPPRGLRQPVDLACRRRQTVPRLRAMHHSLNQLQHPVGKRLVAPIPSPVQVGATGILVRRRQDHAAFPRLHQHRLVTITGESAGNLGRALRLWATALCIHASKR